MSKAPDTAPGTVLHEVIQYLRQHNDAPTLVLAAALGRTVNQLRHHMSPALKAGVLACRIERKFAFWRLGHNLDRAEPPPAPCADEQEARRVVKVSANATASIFAYADARGAAPFSCALHTDGRMSIERHGRLVLELTANERQHLVHASTHGVDAA